jgi:ankyrin repeat protein
MLTQGKDVRIREEPAPRLRSAGYTASNTRIAWLRAVEDELASRRQQGIPEKDQSALIRRFDMILAERIMRQGYSNAATKATFLSVRDLLVDFNRSEEVVALGQWFANGYTEEKRVEAGPTDDRNDLEPLHMAAAFDDHIALQIIIAGQYSVNTEIQAPNIPSGYHTPLDICAWYRAEGDRCAKILLDAGADASLQGTARIAARKGHLNLIKVLESHSQQLIRSDCPTLVRLAMLGRHKETFTWLLELKAPITLEGQSSAVKDPVTGKMHYEDEFFMEPNLDPAAEARQEVVEREGNGHAVEAQAQDHATDYTEHGEAKIVNISQGKTRQALGLDETVESSFQPDPQDKDGRTELSLAASRGALRTVNDLLAKGKAQINSQDKDGRTPLCWAAINNHWLIVERLLHGSADPDVTDKDGRSPMSWAASRGHDETTKKLLNGGANAKNGDHSGRTPLSWAACAPNEAVTRVLINERSVDVNSRDNNGRTPVSWAASNGTAETLWLLLDHKANIFIEDKHGMTPAQYAARGGDRWREAILLCHKTSLDGTALPAWVLADWANNKLLRIAAQSGHEGVVRVLLELLGRNAFLGFDYTGETLLHQAARDGFTGITRLLLENRPVRADVNSMDCGRTPLHLAALGGHTETVRELLKHGADARITAPDLTMRYGDDKTALQFAEQKGHVGVVQILREEEMISTALEESNPLEANVKARGLQRWFKQRFKTHDEK